MIGCLVSFSPSFLNFVHSRNDLFQFMLNLGLPSQIGGPSRSYSAAINNEEIIVKHILLVRSSRTNKIKAIFLVITTLPT